MAKRQRIYIFGDDSGDPGEQGKPYFGYALFGVPAEYWSEFIERRAVYRARSGVFGESKGGLVTGSGFGDAIESVRPMLEADHAFGSSAFIVKDKYAGRWLRESGTLPPSTHFLRNYLVRKAMELMFDGRDYADLTAELVLDRTAYSAHQQRNLAQYLSGAFNERGPFAIPAVTDIVQAASDYVEGLQVADHLARVGREVSRGPEEADSVRHLANPLMRMVTIIDSGEIGTLSKDARWLIGLGP